MHGLGACGDAMDVRSRFVAASFCSLCIAAAAVCALYREKE